MTALEDTEVLSYKGLVDGDGRGHRMYARIPVGQHLNGPSHSEGEAAGHW